LLLPLLSGSAKGCEDGDDGDENEPTFSNERLGFMAVVAVAFFVSEGDASLGWVEKVDWAGRLFC
jgi:hypothetical protein